MNSSPLTTTNNYSSVTHLANNPLLFPVIHKTAEATKHRFKHIFAQYRLPKYIYTTMAPSFTSEAFTTFLIAKHVQYIMSSPHASNQKPYREIGKNNPISIHMGQNIKNTGRHPTPKHSAEAQLTPHAPSYENTALQERTLPNQPPRLVDLKAVSDYVTEMKAIQKVYHNKRHRPQHFHSYSQDRISYSFHLVAQYVHFKHGHRLNNPTKKL